MTSLESENYIIRKKGSYYEPIKMFKGWSGVKLAHRKKIHVATDFPKVVDRRTKFG